MSSEAANDPGADTGSQLDKALDLLGITDNIPRHHGSNLLHAIEMFVVATDNKILERDALARIEYYKVLMTPHKARRLTSVLIQW